MFLSLRLSLCPPFHGLCAFLSGGEYALGRLPFLVAIQRQHVSRRLLEGGDGAVRVLEDGSARPILEFLRLPGEILQSTRYTRGRCGVLDRVVGGYRPC